MSNTTFKPGDRVVLVVSKRGHLGTAALPGATATVTRNEKYLYVRWDRDNDLHNGQCDGGYYHDNFAPLKTPGKFSVGDCVIVRGTFGAEPPVGHIATIVEAKKNLTPLITWDHGWFSDEYERRVWYIGRQFLEHYYGKDVNIPKSAVEKHPLPPTPSMPLPEAPKAATPKMKVATPRKPANVAQNARILAHLAAGNTITPLTAIGVFGAYRLAARIRELRQAGNKIVTTIKYDVNGKAYAEYSLRMVSSRYSA